MIMHVPLIDMGGDDHGKVFTPQLVGKLNTDGVSEIGCNFAGIEGLVYVVGLNRGRRYPLQERQHNFVGILGCAVDSRNELLFFSGKMIGWKSKHFSCKPHFFIIGSALHFHRDFVFVGDIGKQLTDVCAYVPNFSGCQSASLLSWRTLVG